MGNFFKDIFSSIRTTSIERISSPVTGAFVFSWLFYNWRFALLLVFGEEKFEIRLDQASQMIGVWSGFLLPAISAAAICWYLPRINQIVSNSQRGPNHKIMETEYEKKKQTIAWDIDLKKLDAQSSIAFEGERTFLELQIAKNQEVINNINSKIDQYEKVISDLQSQLSSKESELATISNELLNVTPDIERAKQARNNTYSLMSTMVKLIEEAKSDLNVYSTTIEPIMKSYVGNNKELENLFNRIHFRLDDAISMKNKGG